MNHTGVAILSSNYGDRANILKKTISWFIETFHHVRASSVYEMPAVNGRDASYLNAVVIFWTDLSVDEITQRFKYVEINNGRNPLSKIEGHIPLDLDLVIYDSTIVSYKEYCQAYFLYGMRELNADAVRRHAMI